ncbi:MAG: indolepyruvate oxidoreductase subunit beta [Candidatus Cloacimonetes bacterium]|nr:indolepyruvate oxidoreductase subunit beta [Candidatus Cloacimonadota bacterium]
MKLDIILSGVGGQGILSISTIIGAAAVKKGLFLKQAEVHGMSQRGGEVQSHLRISDKPIYADLIPKGKANLIISVEPMESLRYLPFLRKDGWLITNTKPFVNISNYPPIEEILNDVKKVPQHIIIEADKIAKEMGSAQVMNIVMLGAASEFMTIEIEDLKDAIKKVFGSKGDKVVEMNLLAFEKGKEYSLEHKK